MLSSFFSFLPSSFLPSLFPSFLPSLFPSFFISFLPSMSRVLIYFPPLPRVTVIVSLDCFTLKPIYKGSPSIKCSYCGSVSDHSHKGEPCSTCTLSTVRNLILILTKFILLRNNFYGIADFLVYVTIDIVLGSIQFSLYICVLLFKFKFASSIFRELQ